MYSRFLLSEKQKRVLISSHFTNPTNIMNLKVRVGMDVTPSKTTEQIAMRLSI